MLPCSKNDHTLIANTQSKTYLNVRKHIREDVRVLQARYGIRPDMRRQSRTDEAELTHLEKLNLLEAAASLPSLRHELAKYPRAFLTFCQLRRLRLVKSLQAHVASLQGSDGVDSEARRRLSMVRCRNA